MKIQDVITENHPGVAEASDEIRDRLAQMRANTQDRLNTMRSNTQDRLNIMRSGTSATAPSEPVPAAGPRSPRVGDSIEFGKFNSPDRRRGMITNIKGPIITVKTDKGEEEIHLQNKSLSYSIIPPAGESQLTEVDNSTWLRALRRLESGAKPQSDIELALQLKLDGETGIGDKYDSYTGRPIANSQWYETLQRYGLSRDQARDRANNIFRLIKAAPELGELEQAARQQATDQQQAARQQATDQLTHELGLKALIQQHDLSQADTQALAQMDAAARLALRQQMQEMELQAKERLAQVEIDIRNSQEPEADRQFRLQQARENYQHEISVLKITQEGEYKKALLEVNYQIRIKELELIDNREERQNKLDKLNAEKSRELAVIDAETRAKIQVIQAEVDADAQRAAVDLQMEYMQAFKPIWANMLDKASQYGRTLSQQISSVVGALGRLADVKVPRPVAEGREPVELMRSYLDLLKEQQPQAVAEGFTDDLDYIYAMHPQPEKSEQIVFLIRHDHLDRGKYNAMTEDEFSIRWNNLPTPYLEEFGYDLPLWDADDLSRHPNLEVKAITFDQYVQLVSNYIKSEELAGSAMSRMSKMKKRGNQT